MRFPNHRLRTRVTSLIVVLFSATRLFAESVRIDFSGTVSSFIFYDSPLLTIGDPVNGTVYLDYPTGLNSLGSYVTPSGTTTITGGGGRSGSLTETDWYLDGTGPSGTFGGLYYTLDDLVLGLPTDVFTPPPVVDVLALPSSALSIQLRTSQISTLAGGGSSTFWSYAPLRLTSATISAVNSVPDTGSSLGLAVCAFLVVSLARQMRP